MIYTTSMQVANMHHVQKHILRTLCYCKWARFRDMKPRGIDSNLYNYHLKILIKAEMVEKVEGKGYRLSPDGLKFVDHVSMEKFEPRWQPKLLTELISINDRDEILLWPKHKQPFIGRWSLPSGKIHYEDASIEAAMRREISYITPDDPEHLTHRGVVEYRAYIRGRVVSHTIAHVFTAKINRFEHKTTKLMPISSLNDLELSPGTRETIETTRKHQEFFYENYDIDW